MVGLEYRLTNETIQTLDDLLEQTNKNGNASAILQFGEWPHEKYLRNMEWYLEDEDVYIHSLKCDWATDRCDITLRRLEEVTKK